MNKKWVSFSKNYEQLDAIVEKLGISELTARVLINRDIDNQDKARYFFEANISKLHDPLGLKDMDKAVRRVEEAIQRNEKICIYGDYDVDGVTSTAITVLTLRQLGAVVDYYIPNRMEEGYGLSMDGIEQLIQRKTDLIITVDCGIRSCDVVDYAVKNGIDVIITDHHECGEELPKACAVVNPHQEACSYPFKELAGVGVAFKLNHAIARKLGRQDIVFELLDIVTIGTIADIVPLLDENRIIVKNGLKLLEKTNNIGLRALLDICGFNGQTLNSYSVAFGVAPRINAAGRIANASLCVELLLTEDHCRAYEISRELDKDNKERQGIEAEILNSAVQKVERDIDLNNTKVLVLDDQSWHVGVIGIVASKLVERYNLPVVLISKDIEIGKGSARSISGFNLYEALERCKELFIKFGGHELAAGITIRAENIEHFRKQINKAADEMLGGKALIPEIKVDYRLTPLDVKMSIVKELEQLEPFGAGNPAPVFVFRELKVLSFRTVGTEGKHLLLNLSDGKNEIRAIGFNLGYYNKLLSFGKKIDIICNVECNLWNDTEQIQFKIKDLRLTKI